MKFKKYWKLLNFQFKEKQTLYGKFEPFIMSLVYKNLIDLKSIKTDELDSFRLNLIKHLSLSIIVKENRVRYQKE